MKIKPINFLFLLLFIYLSCKETHSETKEDFELKNFNFELKNNILTTENGIDKISYLEIKSDNIISFREDGYEIIKFHEQKIYAGNRNEDELFIIDTTGTIFNIIDTKHKDITVPNRIRDFTLTNENLIIFEQMTNKLYYYSLDGQLTKVESDPDTSMIISTISFLRPNHLVLQKYHDGSNFCIHPINYL